MYQCLLYYVPYVVEHGRGANKTGRHDEKTLLLVNN